MLFQPADWLFRAMQLTYMSTGFKIWLVILALGGFAVSWICEKRFFQHLARVVGRIDEWLRPHKKKMRRRYKILLDAGRR